MKRYILRILLCLFLGVVTTIAIAWGSILWTKWDLSKRPFDNPYDYIEFNRPWPEPANPEWPDKSGNGYISGFWVSLVNASAFPEGFNAETATGIYQQIVWKSGLPSRSMKCVIIQEMRSHRAPANWREGLQVPDWLRWMHKHKERIVLLPLIPMWPGFLIDTLFYSAIWLGVLLVVGATRRAIRRKRGMCPMCTYDLRGDLDSGCPECGWNRVETKKHKNEKSGVEL